jgi:LacI family gluconate utilization system Gnt-I transcriptional repressor
MIESSGVPVIEIMDTKTKPIHQAVGFNNSKAANDMTTLLLNKGYKNIAYVGAKGDLRDQLRQQGYEDAINKNGLLPYVFRSPQFSSIKLGTEILDDILKVTPRIDAVICTNDDVAVGILLSCSKRNLAVPHDLAVTGMHGHDMGQLMYPSLTSVVTPRFDIGKIAATQLLSRINGELEFERFIDLGYEINEGHSA